MSRSLSWRRVGEAADVNSAVSVAAEHVPAVWGKGHALNRARNRIPPLFQSSGGVANLNAGVFVTEHGQIPAVWAVGGRPPLPPPDFLFGPHVPDLQSRYSYGGVRDGSE